MILLSLLVLVAIAAIAGYMFGSRRRMEPTATPPPLVPSAALPAVSTVAPASDERGDAPGISREKARVIRSRDSEADALRRCVVDQKAAAWQLGEFAFERRHLLEALADARSAAARYRQLVIDIESNAPPRILGGAGEPDDLKLIVGVGPVLERMLHSLGVATFRQIAHWTEHDIAEFDAKLPEFPGRIVRDQWVTQARALHRSKYGELA